MPQQSRGRARPTSVPLPWRRLFFVGLLALLYALVAIHNDWPPYNWINHFIHRHDKVVKHRPGFKKIDRYSKEHRYRPAASPVVTKVDLLGRRRKHGDYHGL